METEEEREKAAKCSRIDEPMWEERCKGGIRALILPPASLDACLSLLLSLLPVALPVWLPCLD